jgi:hypothetical protein
MSGNISLLSVKEQISCKNLSSQRTLEGKRAKALLALNDGDTQVGAAKKSGLSFGQVKYLLTAFRKNGLSIFPEAVITEKEQTIMKKVKAKTKGKNKEKGKKKKVNKSKKEKKEKKFKAKSKKTKEKKSKKKKSKKSKKK